ncbi:hypothetical protein HAX54_037952 [Datura stramonium]|uniref:Uncharacterized protein n=1 Tax=Datura stramonium TaxID=4076 RepID=A0ABS8SHD9_DATST|nr:hypothetical protein [Datura stramonium]
MEGGVSAGEPVRRTSTSYEAAGGRRRFTVELRPGETTIVSWKKLLKDATKSNINGAGPGPTMSAGAAAGIQPPLPHPSLETRLAPLFLSLDPGANTKARVCLEYEGGFFSGAILHSVMTINIEVRDEVHGFIGELLLLLSFM